MTSLDLGRSRRRAMPAPACGPMPRLLFWKLAMSAVVAAATLYFRRR